MYLKKIYLKYKEKIPNDYFSWQLKYFTIFGLLLPNEQKWFYIYILIFIPHMIFYCPMLIILESISVFKNFKIDSKTATLTYSLIALHFIIFTRVMVWHIFQKQIFKYISVVQRPTFNFDLYDFDVINFTHMLLIKNKKTFFTYDAIQKLYSSKKIFIRSNEAQPY